MINTRDNSSCSIDNEAKEQLEIFAGIPLQSILQENPNIFVCPSQLSKESNLHRNPIYNIHYHSVDGTGKKYKLSTKNIMGFISVKGTKLNIFSRFTPEDTEQFAEDYFMHYMLIKTLHVSVVDMMSQYKLSSVFDYLTLLFPTYLEAALKQGVYKEYVKYEHNNHNLKGSIDIKRQISRNTPFNGKVAYKTRELSYDNSITQLIRHTIEHIKNTSLGRVVLQANKEIIQNVRMMLECTTSYDSNDRHKVLGRNSKPLAHPYFTAYKDLQSLCLMILRHNQLKYKSETDNNIYGILFNGAWLWESYLNTLLQENSLGFTHPDNITKTDPVFVFKSSEDGEAEYRKHYPDFYKKIGDYHFILDAKYKRMEKYISREDIHQMLTYMYILKANAHDAESRGTAALIYPTTTASGSGFDKIVNGYGGRIQSIGIHIPMGCESFESFVSKMEESERDFVENISKGAALMHESSSFA